MPVGNAGLDVVAAPSRLGAVPRPRRPVTGPAATRTASAGIGPRAAALAPTSPAHVPAGQRANVPGIYLCLRGGPGLPPEPRWRLAISAGPQAGSSGTAGIGR